jgi:hypothetical protein
MRKIFILILLFFLASCGRNENTQSTVHENEEMHANEISSHENETYETELPYEEYPRDLRYEIFNNSGEIVFRDETFRPAWISQVSDGIFPT